MPGADAAIRARQVGVRYFTDGGSITALQELDLCVEPGELVTVLGPSGCGKSTFLRLVADLVAPTSGSIEVLATSPQAARRRRDIGFVFQDPALLPWRTVLQNVQLPLQVGAGASGHGTRDVRELLDLVGLADRAGAYPHQLSGGQRQRVSIARALVSRPRILLMDEPFGALDEVARERLNEELLRIWRQAGVTIVLVTHSIQEAAFLGQRVVVLTPAPGRVRETVTADLPAERTPDIRESPDFQRLTMRLRRLLESS
jgi:NitT/TauT family transport system ATP-binding protein